MIEDALISCALFRHCYELHIIHAIMNAVFQHVFVLKFEYKRKLASGKQSNDENSHIKMFNLLKYESCTRPSIFSLLVKSTSQVGLVWLVWLKLQISLPSAKLKFKVILAAVNRLNLAWLHIAC